MPDDLGFTQLGGCIGFIFNVLLIVAGIFALLFALSYFGIIGHAH